MGLFWVLGGMQGRTEDGSPRWWKQRGPSREHGARCALGGLSGDGTEAPFWVWQVERDAKNIHWHLLVSVLVCFVYVFIIRRFQIFISNREILKTTVQPSSCFKRPWPCTSRTKKKQL